MQPSWESFLDACVKKRVPPEKFSHLVKTFQSKHFVVPAGRHLVSILLSPQSTLDTGDPRIPLYIRQLLHLGACNAADVLVSLRLLDEKEKPGVYDPNILEMGNQTVSVEAMVIQMLTTEVIEGLLKATEDVQAILKALVPIITRYPGSAALGYLTAAVLSSSVAGVSFGQLSMKSIVEIELLVCGR